LNPEPLHQNMYSFAPSRVLFTGVRLAVFSHIASGLHTSDAIARRSHADKRGMRMLLNALVACQLLIKKRLAGDWQYRLTPLAAKYLVQSSPDYMGSMIEQDRMWDSWERLPDCVVSGQPIHRVDDEEWGKEFFPNLVRSLHVISREPAQRAAEALGAGNSHKGLRVLDVACGSGVWGIGIAEADPEARVTALDFPAILQETKKYVQRHALDDRYDYMPGDVTQAKFGKRQYDLALLGHVVHIIGERASKRLFRKLHNALRPGGRLMIAEMIPNDQRTGPPFPVFFALNMLLNSAVGDTYTLSEFRSWLKEAGFARVKTVNIGTHSPLIVASKA
jgi:ubiquinone/menaquinone biosynthesis C-methylase UbiE